jgi:adenylate cyclase class IV
MPRNVEIKASVNDLESVKAIAAKLSESGQGEEMRQSDTFFKVDTGRLKLRHLEGKDAVLIFYSRSDQEGPKLSDYFLATSNVPEDLTVVLDKALGIRGQVII